VWRVVAPAALVALSIGVVACSDPGERSVVESRSGGGSPDGAALYEESCASCHGSDLRGTDKGPSHFSRVYAPDHHPDEAFRSAIANGSVAHHWDFGDMEPVPGLDGDEVEAIISYVRAQQEKHGFEPYPPS